VICAAGAWSRRPVGLVSVSDCDYQHGASDEVSTTRSMRGPSLLAPRHGGFAQSEAVLHWSAHPLGATARDASNALSEHASDLANRQGNADAQALSFATRAMRTIGKLPLTSWSSDLSRWVKAALFQRAKVRFRPVK
jgi:hypothetical protein